MIDFHDMPPQCVTFAFRKQTALTDGYVRFAPSVITDFVLITDDGTDSPLAIDEDGGADNFVAAASILGVSGLTDEASLESGGYLIAA